MRKTLLRACLLVLCACGLLAAPGQAQSTRPPTPNVSFYVTAHSDDWQLFMGSHAYDDAQRPHTRQVFICVTAGQADKPGDAYWRAREAGSRASIQQLADAGTVPAAPLASLTTVNGHSIQTVRYKNTVAYYLRLPDGNVDGKGFGRCSSQSLKKLRAGEGVLTDLEGLNTYATWADLSRTLRQLVRQEAGTSRVTLNISDPSEEQNPGDHSDHRMAGRLGLAAVANVESCRLLYVGYNIGSRKVNLSPAQAAQQAALFSAYCQAVTANGQVSPWDAPHLSFIGRQYYRVRHGSANGPVAAEVTLAGSRPETSVAADVPAALALLPSYPNPFDQASLLTYELPRAGYVVLRIFDLQGRVVQTLVQQEQPAGTHEVWLEVDQFPAGGTYLVQLQANGQHREQRLQIIR